MKCSNLFLTASPRILSAGQGRFGCCQHQHQHHRGHTGLRRNCHHHPHWGTTNQNRMCGGSGGGRGVGGCGCGNLFSDVEPPVDLNEATKTNLLQMIEEEKMAHDVYARFYDTYGLRIFHNICGAEQHHQDMVTQCLHVHNIPDPTEGKGLGEFSNPEMKQIHDELVTCGLEGLPAALRAGAKIEEMDIHDLHVARQDMSVPPHLFQMYERLQRASENHLRAFVRVLGYMEDEQPYVPVILSKAEYYSIVN